MPSTTEITISYKAVTHLLEREYKSYRINTFIKEIPEGIFQGSLIFATNVEDYRYLSTMTTKRDEFNKEYDIFLGEKHDLPLILRLDNGMRLNEFAILYHKCSIHINEFKDIVYAQSEDIPKYRDINPDEQVSIFLGYVSDIEKFINHLVEKDK
jgi:hypothetical protein